MGVFRTEEMGVDSYSSQGITLAEGAEAAAFHDRGVRDIEPHAWLGEVREDGDSLGGKQWRGEDIAVINAEDCWRGGGMVTVDDEQSLLTLVARGDDMDL